MFRDPASLGVDIAFLSYSKYRTFARLNLLRATYLFKQGKEKEAFDETIKVIKMGQMLQDSPVPSMIQYLVGMAIKGIGLENLRAMIKETNLSAELLKSYAQELNQFYPNREGLVKVFKGIYIIGNNFKTEVIDPIAKGKELPKEKEILAEDIFSSWPNILSRMPYFYKPNQTQRFFAEEFRSQIKAINKEWCGTPRILPLLSFSKPVFLTENLIGKALHDIALVSLGAALHIVCLEDFSVGGTQLLMTIKAYQVENGKLPDSLDELVPEYILRLPKDPFDKKVIRYSAQKKIIYSVGKDRKDEGGSEGDRWNEMPDPTFKIEF